MDGSRKQTEDCGESIAPHATPSPGGAFHTPNRGPRIRITRKGKNMNFGQALEALKVDKRVARAGWNGKGMWLRLVHPEDVRTCSDFWGEEVNADPPCLLPWIGMKTADYRFVPWVASQTDMLAEDWEIVE